nr:MAG TPA: hypothetical protein [Caudoviricetes sp.]DAX75017.1 MAG TPA: hypothetical protein [Caudoviricetes sp.]
MRDQTQRDAKLPRGRIRRSRESFVLSAQKLLLLGRF